LDDPLHALIDNKKKGIKSGYILWGGNERFSSAYLVPALNAHSLSGQPQGIASTIKEQQ